MWKDRRSGVRSRIAQEVSDMTDEEMEQLEREFKLSFFCEDLKTTPAV